MCPHRRIEAFESGSLGHVSKSSRRRAMIIVRGWFGGLLILAAAGCATSPASRPAESTAAPLASDEKTKVPAEDSDATVEVFLTALKGRDFAAAASQFDATVKAAVPQEKLSAAWDSLIAQLGALVSWSIVQRSSGRQRLTGMT